MYGYVWGKTERRIEISINNEKTRQTYYGALNYHNKEFIIKPYEGGNGEHTVAFMESLESEHPHQRIAVIWDGATYHKSQEIKDLLAKKNEGKEESQWQFTYILLT